MNWLKISSRFAPDLPNRPEVKVLSHNPHGFKVEIEKRTYECNAQPYFGSEQEGKEPRELIKMKELSYGPRNKFFEYVGKICKCLDAVKPEEKPKQLDLFGKNQGDYRYWLK
jgi:hypothetical protein